MVSEACRFVRTTTSNRTTAAATTRRPIPATTMSKRCEQRTTTLQIGTIHPIVRVMVKEEEGEMKTPTMTAQPLASGGGGAVDGRVLDAIERPRKEPTTPTASSTARALIHAVDSAGGSPPSYHVALCHKTTGTLPDLPRCGTRCGWTTSGLRTAPPLLQSAVPPRRS